MICQRAMGLPCPTHGLSHWRGPKDAHYYRLLADSVSEKARRRSLARMLRDTAGVRIGLTGGQKRALREAGK